MPGMSTSSSTRSGRTCGQHLECLLARGGQDRVVLLLQHHPQRLANPRLVVDDQYLAFFHRPILPTESCRAAISCVVPSTSTRITVPPRLPLRTVSAPPLRSSSAAASAHASGGVSAPASTCGSTHAANRAAVDGLRAHLDLDHAGLRAANLRRGMRHEVRHEPATQAAERKRHLRFVGVDGPGARAVALDASRDGARARPSMLCERAIEDRFDVDGLRNRRTEAREVEQRLEQPVHPPMASVVSAVKRVRASGSASTLSRCCANVLIVTIGLRSSCASSPSTTSRSSPASVARRAERRSVAARPPARWLALPPPHAATPRGGTRAAPLPRRSADGVRASASAPLPARRRCRTRDSAAAARARPDGTSRLEAKPRA